MIIFACICQAMRKKCCFFFKSLSAISKMTAPSVGCINGTENICQKSWMLPPLFKDRYYDKPTQFLPNFFFFSILRNVWCGYFLLGPLLLKSINILMCVCCRPTYSNLQHTTRAMGQSSNKC